MTLLILGLALWFVSHLFKRLAPGLRASLGEMPGRLTVTALSILAVVLMVKGYRAAPVIDLWSPPAFLTHVNNLLMVIAVFLIGVGFAKGVARTRIRHPMLAAAKIWAFAHLLVNGDLASVILFGGLLAWAVIGMVLINRQQPVWERPPAGSLRNDLLYGIAAAALFAAIVWIHNWLGYWPLG